MALALTTASIAANDKADYGSGQSLTASKAVKLVHSGPIRVLCKCGPDGVYQTIYSSESADCKVIDFVGADLRVANPSAKAVAISIVEVV
jgi:hypothetical protein